MCGIFGYYTFNVRKDLREVLAALFKGLHRLEYRGYDSAGLCIDTQDTWLLMPHDTVSRGQSPTPILENGNGTGTAEAYADSSPQPDSNGKSNSPLDTQLIIKEVGKVASLEKLTYDTLTRDQISIEQKMRSQASIAHTRWATHGSPSPINSHPHTSDDSNEFVVVHNGIITNFKVLKDFLVSDEAIRSSGLGWHDVQAWRSSISSAELGDREVVASGLHSCVLALGAHDAPLQQTEVREAKVLHQVGSDPHSQSSLWGVREPLLVRTEMYVLPHARAYTPDIQHHRQ